MVSSFSGGTLLLVDSSSDYDGYHDPYPLPWFLQYHSLNQQMSLFGNTILSNFPMGSNIATNDFAKSHVH